MPPFCHGDSKAVPPGDELKPESKGGAPPGDELKPDRKGGGPPGDELKPESITEFTECKRKLKGRPGGEAGPGEYVLSSDTPRGGNDSMRAADPREGESLDEASERLERSPCDFRERSRSKLLIGTDDGLSSAGLVHRT